MAKHYCNGIISDEFWCTMNADGSIVHHWRCPKYAEGHQPPIGNRYRKCGYVNCKHPAYMHMHQVNGVNTGPCASLDCECWRFENNIVESAPPMHGAFAVEANKQRDALGSSPLKGFAGCNCSGKGAGIHQPNCTLADIEVKDCEPLPIETAMKNIDQKTCNHVWSLPNRHLFNKAQYEHNKQCTKCGLVGFELKNINAEIAAVFAERPSPVEPIRFTALVAFDSSKNQIGGIGAIDQHGQLWTKSGMGAWKKQNMPKAE